MNAPIVVVTGLGPVTNGRIIGAIVPGEAVMRATVRESVVVERNPFGSTAFSLCRAELDHDGTLTIRVIETGAVMHTFQPSQWREARGVGASGLEIYRLIPSSAATQFSQEVA